MKRLSRLRRHRAAGPILMVFALLTIGTTFQVASAVTTKTATTADRSATIEEGKQLFLKGCSSCHGLNAEGGAVAPSLIGVGAAPRQCVRRLSIRQLKLMLSPLM